MDNMVVINDLSFKYNNNIVFNNLNLSIKKGSITTIIGNNGSGKSTLVRILSGLLGFDGSIYIDNMLLCDRNIGYIRKKIGVVFENPDNSLISETVLEDLAFPLQNMNFDREYIYSRVNEISKFIGISNLLNKCPRDLSGGEKQLVSLGCALVTGPDLLVLDEALSMLDYNNKSRILKILKKINKKYGVTIINITHDIEESVYGDDILLIDSGHVIIHDNKENVYEKENLLNDFGIELPFMVSLSKKLSYYDLVDKNIYNIDEMVDTLWQ